MLTLFKRHIIIAINLANSFKFYDFYFFLSKWVILFHLATPFLNLIPALATLVQILLLFSFVLLCWEAMLIKKSQAYPTDSYMDDENSHANVTAFFSKNTIPF